jgi:drug/metabolite transporter (DMT)-like permease
MPVVVLGLLSAVSWGLGDFGGGLASRRTAVGGVLIFSQLGGAILSTTVAVVLGERLPSAGDVGWALLSSVFGGIGLACLYAGLARGRMGVVAPVTGVLVAAIPAVVGLVLQGVPSTGVALGIGLAIASVLVVSRVGDAADGRPSGWQWGLAAGLTLGAVTLTLAQMSKGVVFGPLSVMRLGEAAMIAAAVALWRPRAAWRVPRSLWLPVLAVGACDTMGTAFYIAATQSGPLAIAGVLSALYPVTTVILAVTILREQLARWHVIGVAMSGAAIVLITTGAAG